MLIVSPCLSSRAFVEIVEPWIICLPAEGLCHFFRPSRTASAGLLGVDGIFWIWISPFFIEHEVCKGTTSINTYPEHREAPRRSGIQRPPPE